MVVTIVKGRVPPGNVEALRARYAEELRDGSPPSIAATYLLRSDSDSEALQIATVWKTREALEEMLRSTEVPFARQLFTDAGAEPVVSVYEVLESA